MNQERTTNDSSNIGFAILGFFLPVIGFIVWLVLRGQSPMKARSAGQGAAIGFGIQAIAAVVILYMAGKAISQSPEFQSARATATAAAR